MIEIGTLLQNRYLIEKQIGAGGMGAVYLGVDQRFDNHVAIKETFYKDAELKEAFEREARLLNSLIHPVLPHVTDYFAENNGYFLVMQFIEGEDLSIILKREGGFPVKDVLRWTDNLLDALDYLHSQESPIIHRDIKPHNLKVTARGDIFLLDFGLAKLSSEDTTGAVSVFGYSKTYSPLEQIQGTGTDARSDIFALGATVFHLLTGKPPINALARASQIVAGKSDPLQLASDINPEVPISVAHILSSALALNPEQRFVSANAMRQALEFAVSTDSAENTIDESPENEIFAADIPGVLTDSPVISSAENDKFPALEAFAADVLNSQPESGNGEKLLPAEIVIPVSAIPASKAENVPQAAVSNDVVNKAAGRSNLTTSRMAIVAALMIFGFLTVLYFVTKADSSIESNQNSVVQTAPAIVENEVENTNISVSPTPLFETVKQPEPQTVSSQTIAESRKNVDQTPVQTEPTERQNPVSQKPEPKSSVPVKSQKPVESPNRNQKSRRNSEPQVVPDIESIFTGKSSKRGGIQDERRPRIVDEEWQERRRQRREKRKGRGNKPYLPF